jgi:hypothetical protein
LTRDAEPLGDPRHRPAPFGDDAQELPARLRLTRTPGDAVAGSPKPARSFEQVGNDQRKGHVRLSFSVRHIDNKLPLCNHGVK